MNTQNVGIEIAAQKSSERWDSDPKAHLDCVTAERRSCLAQPYQVWNLQLNQKDGAEEVLHLLGLVSDNVHKEGVLCWERSYPLVSFCVVQPWLRTRDHAIRLYSATGREAWEIARKDLCNNINFSQTTMHLEEC